MASQLEVGGRRLEKPALLSGWPLSILCAAEWNSCPLPPPPRPKWCVGHFKGWIGIVGSGTLIGILNKRASGGICLCHSDSYKALGTGQGDTRINNSQFGR